MLTDWIDVIPFEPSLRDRVATHLDQHQRREHTLEGRRHAAVAIVLVDSDPVADNNEPVQPDEIDLSAVPGDVERLDGRMIDVAGGAALLLCRRAMRLNAHAGQWALPGGRVDPGEDAVEAALRECDEELGFRPADESVIGLLDDYPTRSGYVITPVVIWGGAHPPLRPSPAEVRAVYKIGLHSLVAQPPRFIRIPESERPVVQLPIGNDLIHAPTGAVLLQFRWVGIEGMVNERVDELEQPVFAWR